MKTLFIGRHLPFVGIVLLAALVGTAAGLYWDVPGRIQNTMRARDAQPDSSQYSCPMHPEVISAQAGNCPKCGMVLTRGSASPCSHSGCGAAGETKAHDCCSKPQASELKLPPGHPPISGSQAHSGCPMSSPAVQPPSEKE